jgi:DNA-binding Lrp family transcriptional regulator
VPSTPSSSRLEPVDARIVAAVQADARASYGQIASMVDVSESTVMRRLQRLRNSGDLVVIGVIDAQRSGLSQPVLVQLRTQPGHTLDVARTVAARADVRFLTIVSGRSDIVCELMVSDRRHLATTILRDFAQIQGITSTSTATVLRTYKVRDEWSRVLLPRPPAATSPELAARPPKMDSVDMALISALGDDGRRSYVDLATELDLSESAVARRLNSLLASQQLLLCTLVDPPSLGFEVEAFLRMRVDLAAVDTLARLLASRSEIRYISATAGYSDLTCEAVLRDNDALHEFMTNILGNLRGVRDLEIDVELDTLKRSFRHLDFHKRDRTLAARSASRS